MIKQDYFLRMIQEIVSLLVNALLNRQKIRKESWVPYDDAIRQIIGFSADKLKEMHADEIISLYENDPDRMGKIELAAMTMLKMSDEMGENHLVLKSRLKHEGVALLEYVQAGSNTFSFQRETLISMLKS